MPKDGPGAPPNPNHPVPGELKHERLLNGSSVFKMADPFSGLKINSCCNHLKHCLLSGVFHVRIPAFGWCKPFQGVRLQKHSFLGSPPS